MAYKVAIDAAAGGTNNGAVGNGLIEKDYTLLVSKYINDRLNTLGIENFLVRESDETLSDSQRVNIIKNKYGTGNIKQIKYWKFKWSRNNVPTS